MLPDILGVEGDWRCSVLRWVCSDGKPNITSLVCLLSGDLGGLARPEVFSLTESLSTQGKRSTAVNNIIISY